MTTFKIGQSTIARIEETYGPTFPPAEIFPEWNDATLAEHGRWLAPNHYDADKRLLKLSVHSWLLQVGGQKILIDSCCGNHKSKPARPFWHMLNLPYLERLASAGARPDEVDYVMCTHLHWDHVGWNTQLRDGRWVPTFPNARYVFARREWESFEELHRKNPQPHYEDSILPVMEAGQAQLVAGDFALDDEVWLEPTPGHTPGHVCVHLGSQGARAVVTGDCIHSPVQCLEPAWIVRADQDHALAGATRRGFLERCCESGVTVCATHF